MIRQPMFRPSRFSPSTAAMTSDISRVVFLDCARRNLRLIPGLTHHTVFARAYSCSDLGSDSFFGDFLFNKEINSRPEAGTPTLPSRTISLALRSRP